MKKTTDEEKASHLAEQSVEYVARHDDRIDEITLVATPEEQLISALRQTGLLVEREVVRDMSPPITEERREELAQRLSGGKPLSQIIIEERER